MKKVLINFFVFVFGVQTLASDIWVTTPKPSTQEKLTEISEKYKLQMRDNDFTSSFDHLIGHPTSQAEMAIILDLDSMARAAALNGAFKKASEYYLKLQKKLKPLPNVSGLEKIVLSTRISLAHMATMLKQPQAENLWNEAHSWAPNAVLSSEEFSPAVILQFSKLVTKIKKVQVKIKSTNEAFIFVDGQRFQKTISLEPGHHQVSVLAPGSSWTIRNFEIKEGQKPLEMFIQPVSLIRGTCENPKFQGTELPPKTKLLVVFDSDCSRIYSEHHWYTIAGVRTEPKSNLSDDLKPQGETEPLNGQVVSSQSSKRNFFGDLIRSGWFWAGVGAAVIGTIVITSNQTTTTVPSHTTQ